MGTRLQSGLDEKIFKCEWEDHAKVAKDLEIGRAERALGI